MKTIPFAKVLIILSVFAITFVSCEKDNSGNDKITGEYLSDYSLEASLTTNDVQLVYTLMAISYPGALSLAQELLHEVDVYKLEYKTTYLGEEIIASAVIAMPQEAGEYDLVSFQNGTNTKHELAPSQNIESVNFKGLLGMASMGYIVVLADYIGFGSSEQYMHPYMHKNLTVSSLIDLYKAIPELLAQDEILVQTTNKLTIMGYSQGGWATLALQEELETNNTTDFELELSVCGAGAYNLEAQREFMISGETYPQPYFMAYVTEAYRTTNLIGNDLSIYYNSPYDERIPDLFDGNNSDEEINNQLTFNVSELFTTDFISNYSDQKFNDIRTALSINSVEGWNVKTPTYFYHGSSDNYIDPSQSLNIYEACIAAGADVDRVSYTGLQGFGHVSGIVPFGVEAIKRLLEN